MIYIGINEIFKKFSDALLLKSDLHGVEIEVIKSKSYSLVGIKGIVLQENFSTFKIIADSIKSETKSIYYVFIYRVLIHF